MSRNPKAETKNQEDNVVLEKVVTEAAMEVEDNHEPAGSEVLTADENIADNEDEGSKERSLDENIYFLMNSVNVRAIPN